MPAVRAHRRALRGRPLDPVPWTERGVLPTGGVAGTEELSRAGGAVRISAVSRQRSPAERITGVAVAALLAGSAVVVPLLHAGEADRGPAFTDAREPATASFHHDHAVCLQLQTSTAQPVASAGGPPSPARTRARLALPPTSVTSREGRLLPRARSPPRPLPL